jgi:hypothetical protein
MINIKKTKFKTKADIELEKDLDRIAEENYLRAVQFLSPERRKEFDKQLKSWNSNPHTK